MNTDTKRLLARLFAAAVLNTQLLADAPLPQRPEYVAPQQSVAAHTAAKAPSARTIAVYAGHAVANQAAAYFRPATHVGNGTL